MTVWGSRHVSDVGSRFGWSFGLELKCLGLVIMVRGNTWPVSCSRVKSPLNDRTTCMCLSVGPNLQMCGQGVIYTRLIQLKADIILCIHQGLIANQQPESASARWYRSMKIEAKSSPSANTFQTGPCCRYSASMQPTSHFSKVICNKHVTRGNCQLQTIWPWSTEYGAALSHPVETGSGHKGQHLLYWAYSTMEAAVSCKSQGNQHGLRALQSGSDTPSRPQRKWSLK